MPCGLAAFNEKRRRGLALFMAVLSALTALYSLPVGIYAMSSRAYFFDEAVYFLRHPDTHWTVKSGFGWCAFTTIPIFVVTASLALFMWYNSSEVRRCEKGGFSLSMTLLLLCCLVLCGFSVFLFVSMTLATTRFEDTLLFGISTAMRNYDKGGKNLSRSLDKEMLDRLHKAKHCCGTDGWTSFQKPVVHLNNFSQLLFQKKNKDKGEFRCHVRRLCYVPWSCCRNTVPTCTNQDFSRWLDDPMHSVTMYTDSCYDILVERFMPIYITLSYMYLAYFFSLYLLTIGSRWFHVSVLLAYEYGIPLTPGWIFPCGGQSKDEIMEIFSKHEENRLAQMMGEMSPPPLPSTPTTASSEGWTTEEEWHEPLYAGAGPAQSKNPY